MKKNPGLAAVLSFVLPGVGQIYNGDFLRGVRGVTGVPRPFGDLDYMPSQIAYLAIVATCGNRPSLPSAAAFKAGSAFPHVRLVEEGFVRLAAIVAAATLGHGMAEQEFALAALLRARDAALDPLLAEIKRRG